MQFQQCRKEFFLVLLFYPFNITPLHPANFHNHTDPEKSKAFCRIQVLLSTFPWPLSNNVDHCLEPLLRKFRLMTSTHHCVGGHGGKAQHDSKKNQNYKNGKIHQNWKWTKKLKEKTLKRHKNQKMKTQKKHITSKGKHKGKIKNSKTSPKICKSPKVKINQKNLRKKASNLTKIGNMKI